MRPSASVLVTVAAGIGREAQQSSAWSAKVQPPSTSDQLEEQDAADHRADRRVALEALAQLGEVDVQHHDDEQEQHRDRADIDDDQDHRQELGPGSRNSAAALKKARIRNSTLWTGLRAVTTMTAEAIRMAAKR